MKAINDFLKAESATVSGKEQSKVFTDWLPCSTIALKSGTLQFVETRVLGLKGNENDEVVEIPVKPGDYSVECKCARFGTDARVAGMRSFPVGMEVNRGKKLGEIPVDLGGISVVDIDTVELSMMEDEDVYMDWLEDFLYSDDYDLVKVLKWEPTQTSMITVEGGFGDGCYDVFELVSDGTVVGLEVAFIDPDETSPFEMD